MQNTITKNEKSKYLSRRMEFSQAKIYYKLRLYNEALKQCESSLEAQELDINA